MSVCLSMDTILSRSNDWMLETQSAVGGRAVMPEIECQTCVQLRTFCCGGPTNMCRRPIVRNSRYARLMLASAGTTYLRGGSTAVHVRAAHYTGHDPGRVSMTVQCQPQRFSSNTGTYAAPGWRNCHARSVSCGLDSSSPYTVLSSNP